MEITRGDSRPSGKGPAEYFTGTVRYRSRHPGAGARARRSATVTFRARRANGVASHPLGQTLIVTAGFGRAQRWGGPIEDIRPGDVVLVRAGESNGTGVTADRR
jgi:quercetin dioxygenase-like cupin family protein